MRFYVNLLTCCALIVCVQWTTVAAGRVTLRPLSVRELRRALNNINEPAGRSISPALAAIKGLALGITKGVSGSILYDVVTSNATLAYLSSLLNSTGTSSGTAQEVCFTSRSADGGSSQGRAQAIIDDFSDNDDAEQERQLTTTTGTGTGTTTGTGTGTTTGTGTGTGTGITCIVINRNGSKTVRHRRSANSQQTEQTDQAEYQPTRTKLRSKKVRKTRKLHSL